MYCTCLQSTLLGNNDVRTKLFVVSSAMLDARSVLCLLPEVYSNPAASPFALTLLKKTMNHYIR